MNRNQLITLARRALKLPTAPYHEQQVAARIRIECEKLGLRPRADRFGNLVVRYRRGKREPRPLAFVAHMDHPGFEIVENSRNGSVRARFLGGITRECITAARVRIFGRNEVSARVTRIEAWGKRQMVRLQVNGPVHRGDFGMWDLAPVEVRGDQLRSRGCDDVVGCVALLAALSELCAKRVRADAIFVFTRAEEVGFHGALAMARARQLAASSRVISVETSREIPPRARMGGGPIVRVGDRAAVFHSELTRFLSLVAADLSHADKAFRSQRCLMDGGICEATAFGENGYAASGLCIALGNYHNIGPRQRVAEEFVSLSDLSNLVRLIVAAVQSSVRYAALAARLPHRLEELHARAIRRLSPSFNLLP